MVFSKGLRWITVMGAVAIATTVAIHGVRAQEDAGGDQESVNQESGDQGSGDAVSGAAKAKKTAVHASGPVAIAGTPCASPTTGVECYTISSSALKQGKVTNGTLTGSLLVSTATTTKKNTVCYTVHGAGASTETVTIGTAITKMDFGPANACITTNTKKKTSTEAVTPPGPWTSVTGSAETGSGKETWKVTPTNAASTTSPLAGSGTVSFTGSETP